MKESHNHTQGFIVKSSSGVCCQYTVIHSTHVGGGGSFGGGVLHLPKKKKTSSLQWHLEGINQRCRTVRIYPLWTMSGPSRHSCLELLKCFRLKRMISAAAGAKLLKHQGLILSDFISLGTPAKIRDMRRKETL